MPGLGAAASTSGAVLEAESAGGPAQTTIDLATAEAFAVTALGRALDNAATGRLKPSNEQIRALTAARAEEQAHYDCLTGLPRPDMLNRGEAGTKVACGAPQRQPRQSRGRVTK